MSVKIKYNSSGASISDTFKFTLRVSRMNIITLIFCIILNSIFLFPYQAYSQQPTIKPQNDEQKFLEKKEDILKSYRLQKNDLNAKISSLETENKSIRNEVSELSSKVSKYNFILTIFSLSNWVAMIFIWFFPIMVLNHFIYVFIREKAFFIKHGIKIIIVFIVMEMLFFLPFVASAQLTSPPSETTEKENIDEFDKKLIKINELLKMSSAERTIYILENTQEKWIELPEIHTKDPFLVPLGGRIQLKSPDYYYTLAALYRHIGVEEKVQDALQKLNNLSLKAAWLKDRHMADIYQNVLNAYIQNNQLVEASKTSLLLIDIYSGLGDMKGLIDLVIFLTKNKMNESANVAIKKAPVIAEKSDQVISLAEYFINSQHYSEAGSVISQAVKRSKDINDILPLVVFSIKHSLSEEVPEAIDKAVKLSQDNNDYLSLSRLLFENGRQEESAKVLNKAKEKFRKLPELLDISRQARELGFMSIAIDAIVKALIFDPDSRKYNLPSPKLLEVSKFLQSDIPISLATYLGILQQIEKQFENANISYKAAVERELDAIIRSYGYKIEGNINNFFYLKQLWQKRHPDKVNLLIHIYSHLQTSLMDDIRKKEELEISELNNRISQLNERKKDLSEELFNLKSKLRRTYLRITLLGLRDLAIFIFFVLIIIVSVIKGLQKARSVNRFKFFAFYWKFQESLGWSAVFSVVGAFGGIPAILLSQLMSIIHCIQQSVKQPVGEAES